MAGLNHFFSGMGFFREYSEVAIFIIIITISSMANKKGAYQGYFGLCKILFLVVIV